ncbi:MAG: methyl-accepting chemotaxis protein [Calditrichaeota bacterium]|nr:methyl-accepting chemotaxis protein [Calditrichota bacterium]
MIRKIKSSIKIQLTVFMVLLLMIPISLGSFFTYRHFRAYILDTQSQHIKTIRDLKKTELIDYLDEHIELLNLASRSQQIVNLFAKAPLFLKNPNIDRRYLNRIGQLKNDFLAVDDLLSSLKEESFYFIDAQTGIIFYETNPRSDLGSSLYSGKLSNSLLHNFTKKLFVGKKSLISDFAYYEPVNRNILFMGAPVFDKRNKLLGAVIIELSIREFSELLSKNLNSEEPYEIYTVNDEGRIVFHSLIANLKNHSDIKFDISQLVKINSENEKLVKIKDYRQKLALALVTRLNLQKEFGTDFDWYFIVQASHAVINAPIIDLRNFLLSVSVFLLILGTIVAYWIGKKNTDPIIKINQHLCELSEGNLKIDIQEIKGENELGMLTKNLKEVIKRLHKQMSDIVANINVISSSSIHISATVSQITASSSETATAITQTASSAEEVTHLAENFSEKAKNSLEIGARAIETTNKGTESFESINQIFHQVKSQMEEVANTVINLSKQSQTISEITEAVKEIAEQSNILAINASIEATKAGEYGRSFAVVANEVRNLAEQSKKSTQQIRSILDTVQESIGKTVMQVEQTNKTIYSGGSFLEQAREAMNRLSNSIEQLSTTLTEVAEFSHEQLTGTSQIKEAMENIKEATSQNVNGMRQLEEIIDDLKKTGANLKELVSTYKI